jgi:hypothetical protein
MRIPQCFDCKHLHKVILGEPTGCDAFPDEVPIVMLANQHDHRQPYPGDHGIRFEPSQSALDLGLRLPNGDHRTTFKPPV